MKKYLIVILALLQAVAISAQEAPDSVSKEAQAPAALSAAGLWDQANTAYLDGAYPQAITLYESLLAQGKTGYKLYYNLGNAYFKNNEIGRAILYYSKAQRIAPTNGDVAHNLAVAGTRVKDKIDRVPEFFVNRWVRGLRMSLSGYAWTWISLGMLACLAAAVITYLLAGKLSRRKPGFYGGIVCGMLFIVTTLFAAASRHEMRSPDEGVVMHSAVPVKSSPDRASKDLFVIHEGTKVRVVSQLQEWREVVIADGNKGWLPASSIEMI